ncbi:hypothetical protein Q4557_19305 [Shewanella sp. 5_MG-2023]|uniref:hypothetical protein n=1 Tax=Shewanella sp. 5_MG-2023 TaxID=3062656 RepID=UPI0026E21C76|nr:hypothetical protein [Shewanella sp. 5_MG-2023]MDO6642103.1 hypothetical protein [Shewanella sp. 5_MG-2023]
MSGIKQAPTLGEFHKVVCDSLGLWSDEKLETTFYVPATEKERRQALEASFSLVEDNKEGQASIQDLLSATCQLAPDNKRISILLKTVRAYVIQYAKNDFNTIREFTEFQNYMLQVIEERYPQPETSHLAKEYYLHALEYYREWVREFVVDHGAIPETYQYFVNNVLKSIVINLVSHHALGDRDWLQQTLQDDWPLRRLIDELLANAGSSVYKLCQYHAEAKTTKDVEFTGLKGGSVDTATKQVIQRLSRFTKVKWRIYLQTILPVQKLTPVECDDAYFTASALGAFIVHNLNIHLNDNQCEPLWDQKFSYPSLGVTTMQSASKVIDYIVEQELPDSEKLKIFEMTKVKLNEYQDVLDSYALTLNKVYKIPQTIEFVYGEGEQFSIKEWSKSLSFQPSWVEYWIKAQNALVIGEHIIATKHYTEVLRDARYSCGPLWMLLFFEVCCLCQKASRELVEEQFDTYYGPLGSQVTSYAKLLGYLPDSGRNPKTLMPNPLTIKENIIINKVQQLLKSDFLVTTKVFNT